MKNQIKFIGLISLFAMIVFTMTACDGDKGIPVKVKAFNNNGIAPAMSMARSTMNVIPLTADPSFDELNNMYLQIGTEVTKITPNKFNIGGTIIVYTSTGSYEWIVRGGVFDFAGNLTLDVGNITPGVTVSAFSFHFIESIGSNSTIEFEWASGQSNFQSTFGNDLSDTWNGSKVSIPRTHVSNGGVTSITFGKGPLRVYNNEYVPVNSVIDGISSLANNQNIGAGSGFNVVVPFTPVNIPSSANSVTVEISLDLTNMVAHYEGENMSGQKYNVLYYKNGWWNNIHASIVVN